MLATSAVIRAFARAAEPGRPIHELEVARQRKPGQHAFAGGGNAACTDRFSILERAEPVGLEFLPLARGCAIERLGGRRRPIGGRRR